MTQTQHPPAIFLMGPTAAGKTDLAMKLYDTLGCEIISVDSAMIYKGMDIGTAKPDAEELARYPHRMIDLLDPSEAYSAAEFRRDVLNEMAEITARGKIPLLVGGTMMYFNALLKGLADLPAADAEVRARLLAEAQEKGWPAMHAKLALVDPESAQRLAPNDSQRLQRALEVFELTGRSLTEHWAQQKAQQIPYNVTSLAVMPQSRAELHERIAKRFHMMLEQGFVDEVREVLWERGDLNVQMPSVRCVGYRQVWEYFSDQYDYATMIEKGIVATRQLAKRQITWLRGWERLAWLDTHDSRLLENALKRVEAASI